MKRTIPSFKVINWNTNRDELAFYDVMPYLVDCWKEEKKRKHKLWHMDLDRDDKDDTRMPETFDEFKKFILDNSVCNFCYRCEYEVIVSDWPPRPRRDEKGNIKIFNYDTYYPEKQSIPTIDFYDQKLDVYEQIVANLDIITKVFMDYIEG